MSLFQEDDACPTRPRPQGSPTHHSLPSASLAPKPTFELESLPFGVSYMRVSATVPEK